MYRRFARPRPRPACEPLERRRLFATGAVELVRDFAPGTAASFGQDPRASVTAGGLTYFTARSRAGNELWRTDGTAAGTSLLKDVSPGEGSSNPALLTDAGGGTLFFAATSPAEGAELWRTDGTPAGTALVRDVRPGNAGGLANARMTPAAGGVVFTADDGVTGSELWFSDGTAAGTRLVVDATPGAAGTFLGDLVGAGGLGYFVRPDAGGVRWLVRTDGTAAGTFELASVPAGGTLTLPAAAGGLAYFSLDDGDPARRGLWRTDGTPAGTFRVRADAGAVVGAVGDTIYFRHNANTELWKSNGQVAGTVLVKGGLSGFGNTLVNAASTLYFVAGGNRVWRSDGTAAGTVAVDNAAGDLRVENGTLFGEEVAGRLYFRGTSASAGDGVWSTDGTIAGTRLDQPGTFDGEAGELRIGFPLGRAGGRFVFDADDGVHGSEPWVLDPAAAPGGGGQLLRDVNEVGHDSFPISLTRAGSRAFFFTLYAPQDDGLWVTDGTAAGTTFLREISVNPSGGPGAVTASLDGAFFFAGSGDPTDFYAHRTLWRSDGTTAGTAPFATDFRFFDPAQLAVAGDTLFFTAMARPEGGENYEGLFATDGTAGGTRALLDRYATGVQFTGEPVAVGDLVYFTARTAAHGDELWRSDGTPAGTFRVTDANPGAADALPRRLTAVGDALMFTAFDGTSVNLYRTTGTPGSTTLVKPLNDPDASPYESPNAASAGGLYFFSTAAGVWRSDGTAAGTYVVLPGATFGLDRAQYNGLRGTVATLGDRVFFTGLLSDGTADLWVSDGTAAGTRLVDAPDPADPSSWHGGPHAMVVAGGLLYFAAGNGSGFRLWRTDGSADGTTPVAWPGFGASGMVEPGVDLNGTLLLTGSADPHGYELFRFETPPAVRSVVVDDGSSPQRSMVRSATVTFDRAVALDDRAVAVVRDADGTAVPFSLEPSGDGTSVTLRFAGASLGDGVYTLIVAAPRVHAGAPAGLTMAANYAGKFHRLYSDVDGDGDSDGVDLTQFRQALNKRTGDAGYKWYLDADADDTVDGADLLQLRSRRSTTYLGYQGGG